MDLQAATTALRSQVGDDCGLGTTLKFDCGADGVVLIDATAVPNVVSNDDREAACTVALSLATLGDMLEGELDPSVAFMTGRFKVSGDMSVALKLQRLL
jgi:putative sterol carrier protein